MFIDAYVYCYLKKVNCIENIDIKTGSDVPYKYSQYHYECDLHDDTFQEQLEKIKEITKTRTLTNKHMVFYIKNTTRAKCKHLHKLVDIIDNNHTYFITSQRLFDIDTCIQSRTAPICLAFAKNAVKQYCNDEGFDDIFRECQGDVLKVLIYDKDNLLACQIRHLIDDMPKSKSALACMNKIRDFAYKAYHLNIPFNMICKCIILHFASSPKIYDIIKTCAAHENDATLSSKDIFVYEKLFVDIFTIVRRRKVI